MSIFVITTGCLKHCGLILHLLLNLTLLFVNDKHRGINLIVIFLFVCITIYYFMFQFAYALLEIFGIDISLCMNKTLRATCSHATILKPTAWFVHDCNGKGCFTSLICF